MATQLILLDPDDDFRLDERTRELGRSGVAEARAVLAAAAARRPPVLAPAAPARRAA